MSITKMLPLAGLLLTLGCSAPETPPATPLTAQREAMITTRAIVEDVDQSTRVVRLRMENGEELTVVAGSEVRNLDKVSAGDSVRLSYYESVTARMAEPNEGGPATTSVVTSRAPEGTTPGGLVRATSDAVVEFLAYDPATGIVTYKNSQGDTRSVEVNPAMREFAAARRPGERVAVQFTSAMAASIVPTDG